ncbi:hypothetical protein SKAU_G00364650 [Synaphobranchus kaupii]|uniref:Uncharacterized protein n=1 Tax=Synaphobranchus kaupii TaxID=118154 RepID=A0A9Q1IFA0_SYNKA|nr:hypothetical protein SKAU_G00364650 [Synaphobranchus kaupii]
MPLAADKADGEGRNDSGISSTRVRSPACRLRACERGRVPLGSAWPRDAMTSNRDSLLCERSRSGLGR